jgi:hypothetical protein
LTSAAVTVAARALPGWAAIPISTADSASPQNAAVVRERRAAWTIVRSNEPLRESTKVLLRCADSRARRERTHAMKVANRSSLGLRDE